MFSRFGFYLCSVFNRANPHHAKLAPVQLKVTHVTSPAPALHALWLFQKHFFVWEPQFGVQFEMTASDWSVEQWKTERKKEEVVFLFLKQIINSYWSLLTNWSHTSSFSGVKKARGELRSDWSEWIIAKCLFHMMHRHVCIAAWDFCLIWSSRTASQHFFVIVMYRRS